MGEIAEMMLDGTLCEGCGVYMGADTGFPVRCAQCQNDGQVPRKGMKAECPVCKRKVKAVGLDDHMRDAHGA